MGYKNLIYRIKKGILEQDPNAEIYLFGSRARGDNTKDSDWDILVITPREKVTLDYEYKLRDPLYDIELDSGERISLFVYTNTEWNKKKSQSSLFMNIIKEGMKV